MRLCFKIQLIPNSLPRPTRFTSIYSISLYEYSSTAGVYPYVESFRLLIKAFEVYILKYLSESEARTSRVGSRALGGRAGGGRWPLRSAGARGTRRRPRARAPTVHSRRRPPAPNLCRRPSGRSLPDFRQVCSVPVRAGRPSAPDWVFAYVALVDKLPLHNERHKNSASINLKNRSISCDACCL